MKTHIDTEGPQPCSRADCDDAHKPTERYGVTLLLYSKDTRVHQAIRLHLGLQVCKGCQDKVKASDLISEKDQALFRVATSSSDLPPHHPARIMDITRSKVAFRELGRYQP